MKSRILWAVVGTIAILAILKVSYPEAVKYHQNEHDPFIEQEHMSHIKLSRHASLKCMNIDEFIEHNSYSLLIKEENEEVYAVDGILADVQEFYLPRQVFTYFIRSMEIDDYVYRYLKPLVIKHYSAILPALPNMQKQHILNVLDHMDKYVTSWHKADVIKHLSNSWKDFAHKSYNSNQHEYRKVEATYDRLIIFHGVTSEDASKIYWEISKVARNLLSR